MSACELQVMIDDHCRTVHPGDTITGTVRVTTEKSYDAELKVELEWRTHGKGNRDSGGDQELLLFTGRWLPAETNEYRFSVDVPNGPCTYRGHLLNVDWYVKARAHIDWKIDPKAETEVIVEPPATSDAMEPEPYTNQYGEAKPFMLITYMPVILILFSVVTLGIGVFSITQSSASLWDAASDAAPWLFIGGILGAIGLMLGARAMGNFLAKRKIRDVRLDINDVRRFHGEAIDIHLGFEPRVHRAFSGATATLTCTEEVIKGSGTNSRTFTHEVTSIDVELIPSGELRPLQRMAGSGALIIPPDAPLSFWESSNKIKWELTTRIHLDGWPDWVHDIVVEVSPFRDELDDDDMNASRFGID